MMEMVMACVVETNIPKASWHGTTAVPQRFFAVFVFIAANRVHPWLIDWP
jgi:hypothetical protein